LGGKNPSLVFADANMEIAVKECVQGFVLLSGQICAASTRVYVEESIAPVFIEAFRKAAEGSVQMMGNPEDRTKFVGPIVDAHQHKRVQSYIEKGKAEATLLTGGEAPDEKVVIFGLWIIY
jgi:aldehyde dehydrogenase (NAD+)